MTLFELFFLSLALGVDCLVVSFSQGLFVREERGKISLFLALIMGLFQGTMPFISYLLTGLVYDVIAPFAKILVFSIFMFLGCKFIFEALKSEQENSSTKLDYGTMIILGFATSIDALGAGVSLKLTDSPLLLSCGIIAAGSFAMSVSGFWGGNAIKIFSAKALEIFAGLILVFLAVKALV